MSRLAILGALLGYLAALSAAAPVLLRRSRWVTRSPGLAIRVWEALSAGWLVALLMIAWVLIRPQPLLAGPASAAGLALGLHGIGVTAAVVAGGGSGWAGFMLASQLIGVRQQRRQQADCLAWAGRTVAGLDATVVDTPTPMAYCLPVRGRERIVVTTGALAVLTPHQLLAILAHERAHLRYRHHLSNAVAAALSRAFPFVPLLRDAHREIASLAELAADDVACRRHGPAVVAGALLGLATAQAPAPALGAGGHTVVHRIEHILAPPPPLRLAGRLTGAVSAAGAVAFPMILACATAAGTCAALLFLRLR